MNNVLKKEHQISPNIYCATNVKIFWKCILQNQKKEHADISNVFDENVIKPNSIGFSIWLKTEYSLIMILTNTEHGSVGATNKKYSQQ